MASLCKNLCLARHGANYIAHFKQAMATSNHIGVVRMFSSNRTLLTRLHLQVKSQSSSTTARFFAPRAFHNIAPQTGDDESARVSKAAPSHYLVQIDSFSRLEKHDKFETSVFEAGGYKWKLKFYNDVDNKKSVPVKLALSDTSAFPENWELDAVFSICLKNQITGSYFNVLGRAHFDATKTEFGGFFPKHFLTNPSYGYLKDDRCVFGADVFVNKTDEVVSENMSLKYVKLPIYKREFKIPSFPSLKESGGWVSHQTWTSEVFSAGGHDWMLKVKVSLEKIGSLSFYLENIVTSDEEEDTEDTSDQDSNYYSSDDDDSDSSNKDSNKDSDDSSSSDKESDDDSLGGIKSSFTMTLKSQNGDHDISYGVPCGFFAAGGDEWGWDTFIDKGFILNGCIHLEVNLFVEEEE